MCAQADFVYNRKRQDRRHERPQFTCEGAIDQRLEAEQSGEVGKRSNDAAIRGGNWNV